MAEYRLSGEAFAGRVTAAEPDRLDTIGKRRKLRPLVTVSTTDSLRVEPGSVLTSPALVMLMEYTSDIHHQQL